MADALNLLVWMLGKNTILKAIHNGRFNSLYLPVVWMLGKNTILKAIHNCKQVKSNINHGVNAG